MQTFLTLDLWLRVVSRCCGQVLSVVVLIVVDNRQINDVMQKIEKTLNNTQTQKKSKQTMVSTTLRNTVGEECVTKALASLCRRLAYCRFS